MRYLTVVILSLLSLIGLRHLAHADTSVNVSSNTSGGSNTHVVVNSNVNSSSTTTTNVNSQTHVHIENNGEVKDFNSNGDESVNWQSDDGKSSVKINANGSKSSTNQSVDVAETVNPTGDKEQDEKKVATPSVKPSVAIKHITQEQKSFIKQFIAWLESLFK